MKTLDFNEVDFLIFLLLPSRKLQTLELRGNGRALSKYAQRWNDGAGSLAPEQTTLMTALPWVFPSLPHVHFFLRNVLGPVEKRALFPGSWNEVKVMKFCQLKFRRIMLSSCWDTASSWGNSCVTRKRNLVACTAVGGSRVVAQDFGGHGKIPVWKLVRNEFPLNCKLQEGRAGVLFWPGRS